MIFNYIICCIFLVLSSSVAFRETNGYFLFGNLYDTHRIETRSGRRYCGSEITRTLNFLCESYNKRSSSQRMAVRSPDQENGNFDEEGPRFGVGLVKILNSPNELRYYRRQIRGVVDDCCKRPCTTTQLAQYCDVVRITTTTPAAD